MGGEGQWQMIKPDLVSVLLGRGGKSFCSHRALRHLCFISTVEPLKRFKQGQGVGRVESVCPLLCSFWKELARAVRKRRLLQCSRGCAAQ